MKGSGSAALDLAREAAQRHGRNRGYNPTIVLLSDGCDFDAHQQNANAAAQRLVAVDGKKHFVGCGETERGPERLEDATVEVEVPGGGNALSRTSPAQADPEADPEAGDPAAELPGEMNNEDPNQEDSDGAKNPEVPRVPPPPGIRWNLKTQRRVPVVREEGSGKFLYARFSSREHKWKPVQNLLEVDDSDYEMNYAPENLVPEPDGYFEWWDGKENVPGIYFVLPGLVGNGWESRRILFPADWDHRKAEWVYEEYDEATMIRCGPSNKY
eukprot:g5012.t1